MAKATLLDVVSLTDCSWPAHMAW